MASVQMETECLKAFGAQLPKDEGDASEVHQILHNRMAQMRVASDTGMEVDDSTDAKAVRQFRDQTRLRAILQMNMGSAMGMATPAELLFKEPLPYCGRWGERVLQSYAVRGFDGISMESAGGMGIDSRPAVPGPLQLRKFAERVGPHGSPDALRERPIPICAYSQKVESVRAEAASAKVPTAATGITGNLTAVYAYDEDGPSGPPADRAADAENGKRVWPPAVFGSTAAAKEATDITKEIQGTIAQLGVQEQILSCVPGAYPATVEFVLASQRLADAHRDSYSALGIGAVSGSRADVALAKPRANLLSAMAFATGHADLGLAFRDLASGPIESCSRKPWV